MNRDNANLIIDALCKYVTSRVAKARKFKANGNASAEILTAIDRADYVLAHAAALKAQLAAAPQPQAEPVLPTITAEEARDFQGWKGMDGAIAYHLIERHANGWADVSVMMNAWLEANSAPQPQPRPQASAEDVALVDGVIQRHVEWHAPLGVTQAWQRICASLGVGK